MFNTPEHIPYRSVRSAATLLALTVVLAGCVTTPQRSSEGIVAETNEEITIIVRYHNADELRQRYTNRNNPFIAPFMFFTPVELLVFDLQIETTDPTATIDSGEIELSFGGKRYVNLTPRAWLRFWNGTSVYAELSGTRKTRFERLIHRELIARPPSEKTGNAAGLAIFRSKRFPDQGRLSIEVPTTSLTTGRTTRHRVTLRLSLVEP